MRTALRETGRGEQIEDLFVLVNSIVGSVGVELAEGVPSGELDDLVPVFSNVLTCDRRFVTVFIDFVFVWDDRNPCFQDDAAVNGFLRDTCGCRVERLSGLFTEMLPRVRE